MFLGGEMTGVRESAPGCAVSVEPEACPGVRRSPYFAVIASEASPDLPACSNGIDDDGDGLVDHPEDPGCPFLLAYPEDPPCDDGIDNDGDGLIDQADPSCLRIWPYWESTSCGLGAELALVLGLLGSKRPGRRGACRRARRAHDSRSRASA